MDRFQEMQAFAAVVDGGSFVRGADALALSKTAVSRLVGDLEARLGVRLLHRTTRKLSLTPEGEVFLDRCRDALAAVQEAEAEVTAHAGEAAGQLRVNVPVTFGLLHLAPLWSAFMAQHPKVVLDVTLSDRLVDLVDEGFDVAVRISRMRSSTLVSRPLTSTRLVLCASPKFLKRHGRPKHITEIANYPVAAYTLLAMGEKWEFDGPAGAVTVHVHPSLRSNSGDTCCAAALDHRCMILQPTFLVGPHLASGALVEVLPQFRSYELGIQAVYPSRKHLSPKVRVLVDFLVDAFRMRAWPQ